MDTRIYYLAPYGDGRASTISLSSEFSDVSSSVARNARGRQGLVCGPDEGQARASKRARPESNLLLTNLARA
jgi:hypothetical protein